LKTDSLFYRLFPTFPPLLFDLLKFTPVNSNYKFKSVEIKQTQLTLEEIQKMLNLKEADITQTRFYQEVLEIGEKKGLQQGEANLTIRLLKRRCGNLTAIQEQKVRLLSISQLESLGEALLDFQNMSDWENWLQDNRR
jgi:predicted transposase YdaD